MKPTEPEKSLSVLIPCFNEEGNVANTVGEVERALLGVVEDYELLLVNDASSDSTGKRIDELGQQNSRVRVVHNSVNRGLGYNYRLGVELARKEYFLLIPGDNEVMEGAIREIARHMKEADIIIPYAKNPEIRPWTRRVFSRLFTAIVNSLSGQSLHYYNGPVLHKLEKLRSVEMKTDGFAYQAEILVQLLRNGCTYRQVPMVLRARAQGSSNALRFKNLLSVARTLIRIR